MTAARTFESLQAYNAWLAGDGSQVQLVAVAFNGVGVSVVYHPEHPNAIVRELRRIRDSDRKT